MLIIASIMVAFAHAASQIDEKLSAAVVHDYEFMVDSDVEPCYNYKCPLGKECVHEFDNGFVCRNK